MPLSSGPGSVKKNMQELMTSPIQSSARKKAIRTIARKNGISTREARFKQALAISRSQISKKTKLGIAGLT